MSIPQFITGTMPSVAEAPKPYVHQSVPTYRWHRDGHAEYFTSQEVVDALGPEWSDVPPVTSPNHADYKAPDSVAVPVQMTPLTPTTGQVVMGVEASKPARKKPGRKSKAELAALASKG